MQPVIVIPPEVWTVAVGGLISVVSVGLTLLFSHVIEERRWKREHQTRFHGDRLRLYGEFISAREEFWRVLNQQATNAFDLRASERSADLDYEERYERAARLNREIWEERTPIQDRFFSRLNSIRLVASPEVVEKAEHLASLMVEAANSVYRLQDARIFDGSFPSEMSSAEAALTKAVRKELLGQPNGGDGPRPTAETQPAETDPEDTKSP